MSEVKGGGQGGGGQGGGGLSLKCKFSSGSLKPLDRPQAFIYNLLSETLE